MSSIPQIAILQYPLQDELKVTVQTRCQLSGYELQSVLEKVGIYTEMADPYNVLFILPLQVNKTYTKAVEMIRAALQSYEVKRQDGIYSSILIKEKFLLYRIHINNWKDMKQK